MPPELAGGFLIPGPPGKTLSHSLSWALLVSTCLSFIISFPYLSIQNPWRKPERETPIQYTNAYIWNLERW